MTERSGIDVLSAGLRADHGPPVEERIALTVAPEDMSVRQLVPSVTFLQGEVKRLNGVALTQSAMLSEITSACMAAELERDVRLPAEHVERFLKRERDTYEARGQHWSVGDDILDAFRLHMVTGTPLTEPRPEGGPEALGVGPEPLTDAEELRREVERLTAELEANRQRWYHDDQSRTICVAGHDPETRQCADGGGSVLSEVEYLTQLVEIWEGLTRKATEGEDKARALAARLAADLASARAVMNKALGEVEHEEVVHLLNRYLSARPSTTEEGER